MSIFDYTEQTKKDYLIKFFHENKDLSFQDVFTKLKYDQKFDWLLDLKINDIFKYKEIKKIRKEFVEDLEEYQKTILKFLEDNGIGESGRGFSTSEILDKIGGNANSLRNILNELLDKNIVFSTGETQGKKWIIVKYKKQAYNRYNKG